MKVEGENNKEENQGESLAAQHWHGVRVKIHGCREGEGTRRRCAEPFSQRPGALGRAPGERLPLLFAPPDCASSPRC